MTESSSGCFGLCALNDYRKKSGLTCSFIIFTALNITMVVIGAENLSNCPAEYMVPIYLIVAGSTSLALLMVRLIVSHVLMPALAGPGDACHEGTGLKPGANPNDFPLVQWLVKGLQIFDTFASIFSTCWLIVGSYYVYGLTNGPTYGNPLEATYCDYTAYTFAFAVITIGYVSLVLSLVAALCSICFKADASD